jgi:hypothetical protein
MGCGVAWPAWTSRACSLLSESCALNPRLNNSPITRSSRAVTRDCRFLLFRRLRYRSLLTRRTHIQLGVHRTAQSGGSHLTDRYFAGSVPAGAVASGFSPVRRSWRRSWRPWRRSWRPWRLDWRRFMPWVPAASAGAAAVASAGAAAVPVASCAWASNGPSADDRVKPNAAPSPSRERALRREIISVLIFWLISGLCVARLANWIGGVEGDHLNVRTESRRISSARENLKRGLRLSRPPIRRQNSFELTVTIGAPCRLMWHRSSSYCILPQIIVKQQHGSQ